MSKNTVIVKDTSYACPSCKGHRRTKCPNEDCDYGHIFVEDDYGAIHMVECPTCKGLTTIECTRCGGGGILLND